MDISPNPSVKVLRKRKKIEESMEMEVEEQHANSEGESTVPGRGTTKVAKRKSTATRYVHGLCIDISWCKKVNFLQLLNMIKFQGCEHLFENCYGQSLIPKLMDEFCENFSIDEEGNCSTLVKGTQIDFNSETLGKLLGVPVRGTDVYFKKQRGSYPFFDISFDELIVKYGGKKGTAFLDHNLLSPYHKILFHILKKAILPCLSKRAQVGMLDLIYIHCLASHKRINFPSLMIQHMSHCIDNGFVVGYGALITEILIKFKVRISGVPNIGVSTGNMLNVRALNNLNVANIDDDEDDEECDDVEEEELEIEVEKEKEKKQQKIEKIEKEKEKKMKKKNKKQKRRGRSQRVRNMKILNSPSHDEDESVNVDEVSGIAKEPPSREQTPIPMDTIPPFPSSPPKTASPSPIAPQNTHIPPSTKLPSFSVPKAKETAVVPIPEEQPAVPKSKEQPAAPNPPQTAPSSSQNPTIGATYTLAHAKRLDYLFTLVMGHSEAMMEFANEAKGLNGLVQGVMNKVDKALEGQQVIMERLGEMSTSLQMMNSRLMKLEDDVLKIDHSMAENHQEVMAKLNDVVEEVIEQPSSPKP
uniref:Putative plant transposon protein domain-containing protein n=1 Tax=Beta vulgaris TaxID=161934 RepID=A2I5E9_BETVU|nr:hypothetical protein [Beta vulgaris]